MNVVFMGTPDFAVETLRAIVKAGYPVTGVVTKPDKPRGRKKEIVPGPVKAEALKLGLSVYQPVKVREPEAVKKIEEMKPDLIVVAAFGQIIPKEILDYPKYGCINVHASLLPAYRGAAPIQHAILDGQKETGVTIMRMNEGLDTGDIISREVYEIRADETGGSLFDHLSALGADLLIRTIPSIVDGSAVYTPQPSESTTPYASMIKKEDGLIHWDKNADEIERQVRGMNPWPSAFTYLDGKILKIWKSHAADETETQNLPDARTKAPGEILGDDTKQLLVQTGDGILSLDEVQIAGKKRMAAADFLRGYRIRSRQLGSGD
jgi:methionyl-tRNA formyltransferase